MEESPQLSRFWEDAAEWGAAVLVESDGTHGLELAFEGKDRRDKSALDGTRRNSEPVEYT
jgi:hypothetical protein